MEKKRCWRCGHTPENCTLKKPCPTCGEQHLSMYPQCGPNRDNPDCKYIPNMIYMDQTSYSGWLMLMVVPVQLHNGKKLLNTCTVLDDRSERTIILPIATKYLNLNGSKELLSLKIIRHDTVQLKGATVSLKVSPPGEEMDGF